MMDNLKKLEEQLKKPFPSNEIHWRVQSCGKNNNGFWAMVLAYIDARAVMDRLDSVVGFANWKDDIKSLDNGKTFCKLSVKLGDEWITRTGVAGETHVEKEKGGASDALKRAGVKFGIGRYLYHLDVNFANTSADKKRGKNWHKAKTKKNEYFYWEEPKLPAIARPGNNNKKDDEDDRKKPQKNKNRSDKTTNIDKQRKKIIAEYYGEDKQFTDTVNGVIGGYMAQIKKDKLVQLTEDEFAELQQEIEKELKSDNEIKDLPF